MEHRLDLKSLVERNETPELFNLQTRMIAGQKTSDLNRSTLEIAKKNLEKEFCFVGLTEEFDASLILVSDMLGWNVPFYIKRNVTSEKIAPQSVDEETGRSLREANALDIELHQFAKELFEAKRRAAGPAFESKLDKFQRLNAIGAGAQRCYEKMKAVLKTR